MCVCVSVCLSGPNNLPRLLAPASDSAYRKYMTKLKVFNVWILLKTYGLKVIARNTFQDETERTGW